jgi:hypothetical protein
MMRDEAAWQQLRELNSALKGKASIALVAILLSALVAASLVHIGMLKRLSERLEPYSIQYQC